MTAFTIKFDDKQAEALKAMASRRNITVEELIREQTERALPPCEGSNFEKLNADLQRLWASFPPGFKPPTDEEIEQLIHARRMRKALL